MKMHARVASGLIALALAGTGARAGSIFLPDLTENGAANAFPADFPAAEAPSFAFDNTRQKGLIFNDYNGTLNNDGEDVTVDHPVIWSYDLPAAATVRSYSLTSGNDAPGRDPRDFFLEGSNDGTTWTAVDTVTGHEFLDQPSVGDDTGVPNGQPPTRFETYFFQADAPASYNRYRLRVVETFGTGDDRPQIADIQLFDTVIPEPGSLGVLGLAAVGMLRRRTKR